MKWREKTELENKNTNKNDKKRKKEENKLYHNCLEARTTKKNRKKKQSNFGVHPYWVDPVFAYRCWKKVK